MTERRQARRRQEILRIVDERLRERVAHRAGRRRLDALASRVAEGELDPYTAAETLLAEAGIR